MEAKILEAINDKGLRIDDIVKEVKESHPTVLKKLQELRRRGIISYYNVRGPHKRGALYKFWRVLPKNRIGANYFDSEGARNVLSQVLEDDAYWEDDWK